MGTGKSTIGRAISRYLSLSFVDVDEEISKREGLSISEIFSSKGEGYFRDLEASIIAKYASQEDMVISVGGGALEREENLLNLKKGGVLVCLFASPQEILQRLANDESRPLLAGYEDKLQRIEELLRRRFPNYLKADTFLDTSGKTEQECFNYLRALGEHLKGIIRGASKVYGEWVEASFTPEENRLRQLLSHEDDSVRLTCFVRLWKKGITLKWEEILEKEENIFIRWLAERALKEK